MMKMDCIIYIIFEAILFTLALSTDALIASLAYGSNKIKIHWSSALIIAFICTGILGLSLLAGSLIKGFIPEGVLKYVSFTILILLGLAKLMDNMIKTLINKYTIIDKELKFTMFNLNFILNIYANPSEADFDKSKTISSNEAMSLALALSLDSMSAGLGAAIGDINIPLVIFMSMVLTFISIKFGEFIGNKISNKVPFISWLGGIILIVVAFLRIF